MERYLNRFLESLSGEKGYSDNTIAAYLNDLTQLVDFVRSADSAKEVGLDDCTTQTLQSFLINLQERGYASSTIARKVAAIKSFCHFLTAQGILPNDPSVSLESPKIEKHSPSVLSLGDVERLMLMPTQGTGPKALRDRALLELLYATGMRVTEAVTLNVIDVELDKAIVTCRSRNGNERTIPIQSESALTALREYLLRSRPGLVKEQSQPALFLNHRGEKLTRQGLWLIIKSYADAAGIAGEVTPHTLRHSFAKHLLAKGEDMRRLQELLGHANLSTTQVYAQIKETESE